MDVLCQANSGMGKTVFVFATQQLGPVGGKVRDNLIIFASTAFFVFDNYVGNVMKIIRLEY